MRRWPFGNETPPFALVSSRNTSVSLAEHEQVRHIDERCLRQGRFRQRADGVGVRARRRFEDIATQLVVVRLSAVSTSCSVRC